MSNLNKDKSFDHDFKHEKFTDLRKFGEQAYISEDMLPRRYVYVLTNLSM